MPMRRLVGRISYLGQSYILISNFGKRSVLNIASTLSYVIIFADGGLSTPFIPARHSQRGEPFSFLADEQCSFFIREPLLRLFCFRWRRPALPHAIDKQSDGIYQSPFTLCRLLAPTVKVA